MKLMKTPADLMARDASTGRFRAGFDRLCICGHRLGLHAAANPRPCFVGTGIPDDPGGGCDCPRFVRQDWRAKAQAAGE